MNWASGPFEIDVSYAQLAVFSPDLEEPFNSWTDEQVDAGYSWRPQSVSFGMDEDGLHKVTVCIEPVMPAKSDVALRTLDVTFRAGGIGEVEIASIGDSKVLPLRRGLYKLRYEVFPCNEAKAHVHLTFVPVVRGA
jgi:hypothetical protein